MTDLLVSGAHSETGQANRVNAQTEARLALDQLRREIHCGSSVTPTSASSVTIILPGACTKTALTSAVNLPTDTTINVGNTSNFSSGANTITFANGTAATAVTCTGTTATTFTGCSGGLGGTYPSGASVTNTAPSTVTWCVPASGVGSTVPYSLQRYVGACATGGKTLISSLVSNSIFTSSIVPAATAVVGSDSSATLTPGAYFYDVTAVMTNGIEIPGTVVSPMITSGSTNKVTLTWAAYTPPAGLTLASYNVYGRDGSGVRLLKNTTALTYVDLGPTALAGTAPGPTLPTATITVGSTAGYNSGANTISFGASGNVTCTGTTSTTFTGCSGGQAGTYLNGTPVIAVSAVRPALSILSVSLIVDKTPADAKERFTLNDNMTLRNSRPF